MRGSLALLVFLVLAPGVALAQPSAADLRTARGLFREGVAAGEEEHWEVALSCFERAHELSQRADVLLNVAAAQVELGRREDAIATYRRFQTDADAAMLEQHGAAVESALAELAPPAPEPAPVPPTLSVEPIAAPPVMVLERTIMAAPPAPAPRADHTLAIVLGVLGGIVVVGAAVTLGLVFGLQPTAAPSYQGNVYPYSLDVD